MKGIWKEYAHTGPLKEPNKLLQCQAVEQTVIKDKPNTSNAFEIGRLTHFLQICNEFKMQDTR
jgi:hypothetical protein